MFSVEYGPESPYVNLNLGDETILAYVQDETEAGIALREADPVKWLVGTMAIAAQRMPSEIQDEDLMVKAVLGQGSMDPAVYSQVKQYLGGKGFRWIGGCFGQ